TGMHVGATGSASSPTLSMQAVLYEATGAVEFRYGPVSAPLSSVSASVGISGNLLNYRSITPATPASSSTASSVTQASIVTGANIPNGTILRLTPEYTAGSNTITWSPAEGLFTDAAATVAYVADTNA